MSAKVIQFPLKDAAGTTLYTFSLPLILPGLDRPPTTADDDTAGFVAGSFVVDRTTHKIYFCANNATGAATWVQLLTSSSGSGSVGPPGMDGEPGEEALFVPPTPSTGGGSGLTFTQVYRLMGMGLH